MLRIVVKSIQHEADQLLLVATLPLAALPRAVRQPDGSYRDVPRTVADPPEDHRIIIPLAAIANRQRVYGLPTAEAALHAILREHCKRLNALPDGNEHADPRINTMGGLRADVDVVVAPAAQAALDQILAGL